MKGKHEDVHMKTTGLIITSLLFLYSTLLQAQNKYLTMGVFPYVSTSKIIIHNNVIRKHVNNTTDYDLALVTAKNLPTYINNLKEYKYDLVFSAPHLARHVEKKYHYKRVIMTSHKIKGVYITKNTSSIRSINELKGKTISLTPAQTVIHQMVLNQFDKHGIVPGENIKVKKIKTFSNAIYDVLNGNSDVAVTGVKIWKKLPAKVKKNLRKLGETKPVSGFVILAKPDVGKQVIIDIQNSLLSFNNRSNAKPYIFTGFKLIEDADMNSLDFHARIFE